MKFLIIRFSSIGDIVLTTPVIRCLKKQVATAEVHYLTKEFFKPILIANPYIDRIHTLKDNLDAVIEELKKEDFDYIIDLHHNLRSLKVKRALKKKSYSFNKLNIEKWMLTALKINRLPSTHIVDRYMQTLDRFGVANDGAGLDYFIPDNEMVKESDIPASHHAGYIGMVIGAALSTKKFPLPKLKALCASLQHPIILLGGAEDRDDGEAIASSDNVKIYNACGKFSINESADLVRRAKLIVTNDTGLMHIASAFKRPVISLWGNTVPEFGMYPYYGENFIRATIQNAGEDKLPYDIIEIKNLSCRPCSKIGYKICPQGHFKCMELIDIKEVENTIYERINNRK
ncbi:MAG TPA: glycosyltransferase family 9 protein [Puia sp.]|nr:glycosyltransferase family 9 protein [Puia sp.]